MMWSTSIASSLSSTFASSSNSVLGRFAPIASTAASSRAASTVAHLGDLQPAKGSRKVAIRYGRGQGSTKGGTSGRGHKGQKARSGTGKPVPGYEGGQTPIHRLFPKRGFVNFASRTYAPLQLSKLQQAIQSLRIDPNIPINVGTIIRSNIIHGISGFSGVKLLGPSDPEKPLPPLELELSRFSKSAAKAILDAGGKVTAVYHNKLGLRQEVYPEKFVGREVVMARPIRKTDIEYYTNPKKFGYLAVKPEIAESVTETTTA